MLRRVEIKGFRSIKDAAVDLHALNVLIGANGSGKSNFIAFFKMLNEMMGGRLQAYIGQTGRAEALLHLGPKNTPQFEARLEFEVQNGIDTYEMRLFHAAGDSLIFAEEGLGFHQAGFEQPRNVSLGAGHAETRLHDRAADGEPTAKALRYLLSQCRVYHFHDTSPTARIRQYCLLDNNRWLMPDGGNLAAMLYAYRLQTEMVYKRIVSAVRKILPEFDDFDLQPDRLNSREIILNWKKRGSDYVFGAHQLSDGTLRAMALVALFLQPDKDIPALTILDEPELGIHPQALELIAGLIRAASVKKQVIVATQSAHFLNYFDLSEIIIVESEHNRTGFRRLAAEPLKDWLDDYSVGELWQRNVLGGGPVR